MRFGVSAAPSDDEIREAKQAEEIKEQEREKEIEKKYSKGQMLAVAGGALAVGMASGYGLSVWNHRRREKAAEETAAANTTTPSF